MQYIFCNVSILSNKSNTTHCRTLDTRREFSYHANVFNVSSTAQRNQIKLDKLLSEWVDGDGILCAPCGRKPIILMDSQNFGIFVQSSSYLFFVDELRECRNDNLTIIENDFLRQLLEYWKAEHWSRRLTG